MLIFIYFVKGLRWAGLDSEEIAKRKGQIFLFDFKNPNNTPTALSIIGSNFDHNNFNPHGISLWQDPKTGKPV